ncbi:hypothetical protein ALP78_200018 [Pseudomonas coronafaciens pv. striafaciens]|uniref:Uncharacterized protein n=1 Tax=Pseudomonas coronafaciens pv. striafaciens TaxID=235276 RepID=A0A3M4XWK1_9PSED|nr:hypothetical protein ALP78_200018 [Pseudomonas coronafaciens pv. striafaciens]
MSNYSANNRQRCAPTVHQRVFTHSGPNAAIRDGQQSAKSGRLEVHNKSAPFSTIAQSVLAQRINIFNYTKECVASIRRLDSPTGCFEYKPL